MRPIVATLAILSGLGCSSRSNDHAPPPPPPPPAVDPHPPTVETIRDAEAAAIRREPDPRCRERIAISDGLIQVNANDYVQPVERGSDFVNEPIPHLDVVVSKQQRIAFTLDYPFERQFEGSVTGDITLRRIIDAVRTGFRHMYEGASARKIPNMENVDVTGPYGRAVHGIGDLVIEHIDLCDDRRLDISIGS
jgi:hypothetical protein